MTDWYRYNSWDEQVAADFEARLARARPFSRAQYLSLQGHALLSSHPEVSEELLVRAVSLADASEFQRACCYLALSRVAQGKIDPAIAAYNLAIDAERQDPRYRSTAGIDQAFLIALFDRRNLDDHALEQLTLSVADKWSLAGLEALAADAIIRSRKGQTEIASQRAQNALEQLSEELAGRWAGISFDDLRTRLQAIAE